MNSNLIMAIAMKALKNSKSGGKTVKLDKTLKNEGQAADAKAAGDAIEALKQYLLPGLESTWTDLAKAVSTGLAKEMIQIGDIIEIAFGTKTIKVRVLDIMDTTKKEQAKDLFEYI